MASKEKVEEKPKLDLTGPLNTTHLNALYTAMLESMGAVVDAKGFVSQKGFGPNATTAPLLVNGKRLVLPTTDHLRNRDRSSTMVFHPLNEVVTHGESLVVAHLRKMIAQKLSFTLTATMVSLMRLAGSVAEHKKLNPDQSEFLSMIGAVDDKTSLALGKYIMNLAAAKATTKMVNLYLVRGGVLNKKSFSRVATVTFDAYKEIAAITDPKQSVNGVAFRVRDRAAILALFQYILPQIAEDKAYSVGGNSTVAPFTDVLMRAYAGVASRLNDVVTLFKKHIDGAQDMIVDLQWLEAFVDLGRWQTAIISVPTQEGNEGSGRHQTAPATPNMGVSEVVQPALKSTAVLETNEPAHVEATEAVVPAPAPAPAHGKGGFFASLPPAQPTMLVQQPLMPFPQMNAMAMRPSEPLLTDDGKVNFRAAFEASGMAMMSPQVQLPADLQMQHIQAQFAANGGMMPPNMMMPGGGFFAQHQQPMGRATFSGGVSPAPTMGVPARHPGNVSF